MSVDNDLQLAQETVGKFMHQHLLTPPVGVAEIVAASPARRRWRSWSRQQIAAAGIILILALSFFVPPLARVIAAIPVLGSGYTRILSEGGLDVAYQAGLVTELNRSVTKDGVTLTAVSAYSDRLITTYVLKLTHAEDTWAYWQSTLKRFGMQGEEKGTAFASGWSGYFEYDAEEDAIYYLASKQTSLPWWTRLKVFYRSGDEINNMDFELKLAIPVQKVSDWDTVKVNKELTGGAMLKSVTFTPARTQINYDGRGRIPVWGILLPNGSELLQKGSNLWSREPSAVFPATTEQELTIVLKGYEAPEKVSIPLKVGAEYRGKLSMRITDIEPFSHELVQDGAPMWRIRSLITPFHRYPHLFSENGVFDSHGERIDGIGFGGSDIPGQDTELVITVRALPENEDYTLQFTVIVVEEVDERVELRR